MEELIKTFHVETSLVIAQLINFTIVLYVLYRFAYKPILKTLNDRAKKIEKGIEDAENAKKKMEEMTEKEREILIKARKEAQAIVKEAEENAKKNTDSISQGAKEQAQKIIEETKEIIKKERETMVAEVKKEIGSLVILATEKLISEKIDKEKDRELIETSINKQ